MDRPTVSVWTDISAAPERVWQFVTDIALMPQFSDELQSVAWTDGGGPHFGARFTGTNTHPGFETWTTQSCVVAYDPPRAFAWAVGDSAAPAATWRFDLADTADGTRLRYTAEIGPGRSGVSVLVEREPDRRAEIVAWRLAGFERGMTAALAGIKALAESTAPSAPADGRLPHR